MRYQLSTVLALGAFTLISYQNCASKVSWSAADADSALSSNSVLPTPSPTPTSSPSPSPTATPVATATPGPTATPVSSATPTPTPSPTPIGDITGATTNMCSTGRKASTKGALYDNVMKATSIKMILKKQKIPGSIMSETTICENDDTATIQNNIAVNRTIDFPSCASANGDYVLYLQDQNGTTLLGDGTGQVSTNPLSLDVTLKNGKLTAAVGHIEVLADYNPQLDPDKLYQGAKCDSDASPLYVDLRKSGDETDILSSPEDGVYFDILGANAPVPHQPIKISWFQKGKFGLVTLPNENGEVLGIDQLFGNNTQGPDGEFAANGFLALEKYDANGDGVIDANDPVFSKLRLWIDRNHDGKATPDELVTLKSQGIVSISLDYNKRFSETDQYGNVIKYKSVARKSDGTLKPVFDVWFKLP